MCARPSPGCSSRDHTGITHAHRLHPEVDSLGTEQVRGIDLEGSPQGSRDGENDRDQEHADPGAEGQRVGGIHTPRPTFPPKTSTEERIELLLETLLPGAEAGALAATIAAEKRFSPTQCADF